MIGIFTGLPGAGKSLKLAQTVIEVLYRNKKLYEKRMKFFLIGKMETKPEMRQLFSNLHFSKEVMEEFPNQIFHWSDPAQLTPLRDVDVVWDEIATHLDSTQWANMSLELKRWLQQHRKFGIEIYGTTQDFAQIDKSMRRLTSDLQYLTKLFGSGDISPTKEEVKFVWGLVLVRSLDPTIYDEAKSKFGSGGFPQFFFITRDAVNVFNTREEIKMGKYPPLRHIERDCELSNCSHIKTIHV